MRELPATLAPGFSAMDFYDDLYHEADIERASEHERDDVAALLERQLGR